jgi:hypothetical protein
VVVFFGGGAAVVVVAGGGADVDELDDEVGVATNAGSDGVIAR